MKKYLVKESESGQTLEKYVRKVLKSAPLSVIYKLFRKKDIKVNGHWEKEKYVISEGEEISIYLTDTQLEEFERKSSELIKSNITSWIIYEDKNILIINKPRNVIVQKDDSGESALDDMVLSYLIDKGEYDPDSDLGYKPAPAHRLDRNTAGLIIFGKNIKTLRYLSEILSDKEVVTKKYLALVKGRIESDGEINLPLLKNPKIGLVSVSKEGKEALTKYHVEGYYGDFTLVSVTLLTGRTHQIRVHFASIGHPVIGDKKYGDFALNKEIEEKYHFKNQFLVANELSFSSLKEPLKYLSGREFEITLPKECLSLLEEVKKDESGR